MDLRLCFKEKRETTKKEDIRKKKMKEKKERKKERKVGGKSLILDDEIASCGVIGPIKNEKLEDLKCCNEALYWPAKSKLCQKQCERWYILSTQANYFYKLSIEFPQNS